MAKAKLPEQVLLKLFEDDVRKASRKKIAILEATIKCMTTQGVESASLDAVGKILGMKGSHIVYYFPNREALLDGVIELVTATAQTMIVDKLTGVEGSRARFTTYIAANFDYIAAFPNHGRTLTLMYYYSSYRRKYQELHTRIRGAGLARISGLLEGLVSESEEWRLAKAKAVQCIITGYIVDFLTTQSKHGIEWFRDAAINESLTVLGLPLE